MQITNFLILNAEKVFQNIRRGKISCCSISLFTLPLIEHLRALPPVRLISFLKCSEWMLFTYERSIKIFGRGAETRVVKLIFQGGKAGDFTPILRRRAREKFRCFFAKFFDFSIENCRMKIYAWKIENFGQIQFFALKMIFIFQISGEEISARNARSSLLLTPLCLLYKSSMIYA